MRALVWILCGWVVGTGSQPQAWGGEGLAESWRAIEALSLPNRPPAAEKLLAEALEDLNRRIGTQYPTFEDVELERVPGAAVEPLYFGTLAYGVVLRTFPLFSQIGAARRFQASLEAVVRLDSHYRHGAPLRTLARYFADVPAFLGGDDSRAVELARKASGVAPFFAENWVTLAEVVGKDLRDDSEYLGALRRAMALPESFAKISEDEHRSARRRARDLLVAALEERAQSSAPVSGSLTRVSSQSAD